MPRRGPTSFFPSYFLSPTPGFLPNATFSSNLLNQRPWSFPFCSYKTLVWTHLPSLLLTPPGCFLSHRYLKRSLPSRQFDRGLDSPCSLRARPTHQLVQIQSVCTQLPDPYIPSGLPSLVLKGPVSSFLPRCLAITTSLTKPPLHLGIVFIFSVPGRPFCLYLFCFMLLRFSCTSFLCQGRCPSFFLPALHLSPRP